MAVVTLEIQNQVAELYIGFFGRAPDAIGFGYWAQDLANGATPFDVAANFARTPEFVSEYGGLTPDQQVDRIYLNVLNRSPDAAGLKYWAAEIASGTPTSVVVYQIVQAAFSGSAVTNPDPSVAAQAVLDQQLVQNKVTVGQYFAIDLASNDTALAATAFDLVTSDPASVTAAEDYLNGSSGGNYQLTTGIDAPGTGAFAQSSPHGNSVTYGLFGGDSGNTFNSGDVIQASGVNNKLSLSDQATGSVNTENLNLISTTVSGIQSLEIASGRSVQLDTTAGSAGWAGLSSIKVNTSTSLGASKATSITTGSTVNVTATESALGTKTLTIDGGNTVNVTSSATGGAINVGLLKAAAGDVTINSTSSGTTDISATSVAGDVSVNARSIANKNSSLGTISVATGGSSVNVTQTAENAVNTTLTLGAVNVIGTGALTTVTIDNAAKATASSTVAGVSTNTVSITDVNGGSTSAGTITDITVSNFTTLGISDNALKSLNITGGSGNVIIDNSGLTNPTNKNLALGINGQTGGTLDDADIYTKLDVTTSGANSTLANITFGALTDLNIDGTKTLTFTSTAGLTALKTVTVSGAAGITGDFSGAKVTDVNASASTGAVKVTIDGSKATFEGGEGTTSVKLAATAPTKTITLGNGVGTVDITGITGTPTGKITAGNGAEDTLVMTAALAATSSADSKFAGVVSGFENLTLTGATNQTVDLAVLGKYQNVSTSGGNGLTLSNFVSGGDLTLTGAGTAYTIANSAFTAGANDTVNLHLTDGSGKGVAFAATGITAANVENVNITTADTQATPSGTFNDTVSWLGNSVKNITIDGNAGLNLTATSTALTSVDASGISLGGFTYTSGALTSAATIKGSASGTNTIDGSAATAAITYVGGTGADAVTINNAKNNVIDLGDGTNSYTSGNGSNSVIAGKNADTVTLGSGNNTVKLGDGANTFTATNGNNIYTGGDGVDTVTVGGGVNTLTLGAGADTATFTAVAANVNSYSTITDLFAGDKLGLIEKGTEVFDTTKVILENTAVFQDYANAVIQEGGNASVNGYIGWFQFSGNTYVVESLHDGSGNNASFVNGTDFIVKLTGLVDLSTATLSGNVLTLA